MEQCHQVLLKKEELDWTMKLLDAGVRRDGLDCVHAASAVLRKIQASQLVTVMSVEEHEAIAAKDAENLAAGAKSDEESSQ